MFHLTISRLGTGQVAFHYVAPALWWWMPVEAPECWRSSGTITYGSVACRDQQSSRVGMLPKAPLEGVLLLRLSAGGTAVLRNLGPVGLFRLSRFIVVLMRYLA